MTQGDLPTLKGMIDPRQAAMFLDFDGTLVDLAPTPDAIVVPDDLTTLLNGLHGKLGGRLAIITGRTDDDVSAYLSGFEGPIYGSHGGRLHWNETRKDIGGAPDDLDGLTADAQAFVADHPPVTLEEKSMGFAVHYRKDPGLEQAVRDYVEEVVDDDPAMAVQSSKMAFEVKAADVNKGAALCDAMERFGWSAATPWMFGDDTTDEAAFEAAQSLGGRGVKIGLGDSRADFRLSDPSELHDLLNYLRGAK